MILMQNLFLALPLNVSLSLLNSFAKEMFNDTYVNQIIINPVSNNQFDPQ
jgi:hypothetical protein